MNDEYKRLQQVPLAQLVGGPNFWATTVTHKIKSIFILQQSLLC